MSIPKYASAVGNCTVVTPYIKQCEVGIDSDLIPITAPQQRSEWCWAACISMLFAYYDHPVSQQRIVKETWGTIVNMPGTPGAILADLNRNWTDDDDDDFRVSGDVFSANAATATDDFADDKPLILGTMGHAVVLTAMSYAVDVYGKWIVNSATVRDPWPGRGKRWIDPDGMECHNICGTNTGLLVVRDFRARTNLINSPPGQVAAGGVLAGIVWKFLA